MSSVKRNRTNDINTHYVQNSEFIDVIAGGILRVKHAFSCN